MQINRLDPNFAVGPQIALGDIQELAAAGFTMVVNNRPDGEAPDQPASAAMEAEARRHKLDYRHIPVSPSGFGETEVEALAETLKAARGPVFAFCRSGTRSTNLWKAAQLAS